MIKITKIRLYEKNSGIIKIKVKSNVKDGGKINEFEEVLENIEKRSKKKI